MDESTCLESMRLGNGTVGSNPTLSAIPHFVCTGRSLLRRVIRKGERAYFECGLFEVDSDSRTGAGPCAIEPCEPR